MNQSQGTSSPAGQRQPTRVGIGDVDLNPNLWKGRLKCLLLQKKLLQCQWAYIFTLVQLIPLRYIHALSTVQLYCHQVERGIHPEITWAAKFLLGASIAIHKDSRKKKVEKIKEKKQSEFNFLPGAAEQLRLKTKGRKNLSCDTYYPIPYLSTKIYEEGAKNYDEVRR